MNILYIFILAGFFWNVIVADISTNSSSKLGNLIYDRCKRNSLDASTYDKVKEKLEDFVAFMRVAFSHIPKGKEQFCNDDRETLIKSAKELAQQTKQCFNNEEKYLPAFVYESFGEFLSFLCVNNGKNIDNIFSTLGKECMQKLKTESAGTEVGHCFNKVVAPLDGKVKKEKLCEDITIARKCFDTTVVKHCSDFRAFEELNRKFFKAIQKPCNEPSAASPFGISSLVLIIVTFIFAKTVA